MSRLEKNVLEWSVFAVALLLVVATAGYLVREALTTSGAAPDLVVTLGSPAPGTGGHRIPVEVENRGGETAEAVRVSVVLEGPAGREEAVLMMPYLPRESRRKGWVVFRGDPAQGGLRVGAVAYEAP